MGASGPRAGFWRRLGAAIIDGLITGIVSGILYVALKTAGYALGLILTITYFTYFEGGLTGQTFGKKAMGIRVIDFSTGGPIGYGRAFIRYIGRIVSALIIYIGTCGCCGTRRSRPGTTSSRATSWCRWPPIPSQLASCARPGSHRQRP